MNRIFTTILFTVFATCSTVAHNYVVIGDKYGEVKLNNRSACIGDTLRPNDVITIGNKAGSTVWLYAASGKNIRFFKPGNYSFKVIMDSIRKIQEPPSLFWRVLDFVVRKAKEHHITERTDNASGSTTKSVAFFFPRNFYLLLTDTITFQWRNATYNPQAQFILADTVLYSSNSPHYMNAIINDSTVLSTYYHVNLQQLNLRTNFIYYWCVNYHDGNNWIFHPFYYVAASDRQKVKQLLSELENSDNSPETLQLKDAFIQSFFLNVFPSYQN